MGWVRAGRRFGGWLALFALALQLVLAFGHIHAEDFAGIKPGLVAAAQADSGPAGDGDHGTGHNGCAICATIHLARTLVTPTPPAIVLPAMRVLVRIDVAQGRTPSRALAHSFQARGPPQT